MADTFYNLVDSLIKQEIRNRIDIMIENEVEKFRKELYRNKETYYLDIIKMIDVAHSMSMGQIDYQIKVKHQYYQGD